MKKELYLGLDVHKDCIATAVAKEGRRGEVRDTGVITNDLHAVEKLLGRLPKAHRRRSSATAWERGVALAENTIIKIDIRRATPKSGWLERVVRCVGFSE